MMHASPDHAILLLHGLSSSPGEMLYLTRHLRAQGYVVCTPVLQGYSAGGDEGRMEDWIERAVSEFDALAQRYRQVSICGLSIGATLALAVAQARPTAQAVVLLSVTLDCDGWATPFYAGIVRLASSIPLAKGWRYDEREPFGLKNEAMRARVKRDMQKNGTAETGPRTLSLHALREADRLAATVKKHLREIRMDCLVVHAVDDETASPNNALRVLDQVGSVFKRSVFLGDSYHMITFDNERELVAHEVESFLNESLHRQTNDAPAPVLSRALARHTHARSAHPHAENPAFLQALFAGPDGLRPGWAVALFFAIIGCVLAGTWLAGGSVGPEGSVAGAAGAAGAGRAGGIRRQEVARAVSANAAGDRPSG